MKVFENFLNDEPFWNAILILIPIIYSISLLISNKTNLNIPTTTKKKTNKSKSNNSHLLSQFH